MASLSLKGVMLLRITAALPSDSLLSAPKLFIIPRKIHRKVEMRTNSCRKCVPQLDED